MKRKLWYDDEVIRYRITINQSLIFKQYRISTTTRGKFTIFAPLYRSLIVNKYLQKGDPNFDFYFLFETKKYYRANVLGNFNMVSVHEIFIDMWPFQKYYWWHHHT